MITKTSFKIRQILGYQFRPCTLGVATAEENEIISAKKFLDVAVVAHQMLLLSI